jgi:hypothetical protein
MDRAMAMANSRAADAPIFRCRSPDRDRPIARCRCPDRSLPIPRSPDLDAPDTPMLFDCQITDCRLSIDMMQP